MLMLSKTVIPGEEARDVGGGTAKLTSIPPLSMYLHCVEG